MNPHRTFKKPVLKFSAPRAPFNDKLQMMARRIASLLYNHPFAGHIPALVCAIEIARSLLATSL